MSDDAPVLTAVRSGVFTVTLNRPERHNALDSRTYRLLTEALDLAAGDDAVRCVLLRAVGRSFTAGLDVEDTELPEDDRWEIYERFISALEEFPKPVVAAVNGPAVGIGTTMLASCDLVLAAEVARFRLPFVSLGLSPEAGSTATMPIRLGAQRAAHALFTASWISAQDAAAAGLILNVVPAEELDSAADLLCAEISQMPLAALTATKSLLLASRLPAARAARRREEAAFRQLQHGPDYAEAVRAFRERRRPVFHN